MAMPLKKKVTLLLIGVALLYFFMSYHIIIIEGNIREIRLLKKSTFTLEYTFFSTKNKSNKYMLAIDILREDGIGELLIEEGLMTKAEQTLILKSLRLEE